MSYIFKSVIILVFINFLLVGCSGGSSSEPISVQDDGTESSQSPNSESSTMADETVTNSIALVSVETMVEINSSVEAVHGTHIPIDVAPTTGRLTVVVTFLDKPVDFQIFLVNQENTAEPETLIELLPASLNSENVYLGEFDAPLNEFTYRLAGKKASTGDDFSVNVPRSFP